jgi:hypothetical protein
LKSQKSGKISRREKRRGATALWIQGAEGWVGVHGHLIGADPAAGPDPRWAGREIEVGLVEEEPEPGAALSVEVEHIVTDDGEAVASPSDKQGQRECGDEGDRGVAPAALRPCPNVERESKHDVQAASG